MKTSFNSRFGFRLFAIGRIIIGLVLLVLIVMDGQEIKRIKREYRKGGSSIGLMNDMAKCNRRMSAHINMLRSLKAELARTVIRQASPDGVVRQYRYGECAMCEEDRMVADVLDRPMCRRCHKRAKAGIEQFRAVEGVKA